MLVTVALFSDLKKYSPRGTDAFEFEVQPGTSVAGVVEALGIPPGEVWLAAVNGRTVDEGHQLSPGDRVALFSPVAGG